MSTVARPTIQSRERSSVAGQELHRDHAHGDQGVERRGDLRAEYARADAAEDRSMSSAADSPIDNGEPTAEFSSGLLVNRLCRISSRPGIRPRATG